MTRGLLSTALVCVAACARGDKAAANRTADSAATVASTTIPRSIGYDQHIAVEGKRPAGATLTNPFANDNNSAKEGAALFTQMNCDGCHSGGGTGAMGPSLSDGRWRYGGSDGAIYQTIYYGRPQGMPAFGGVLEEKIVWKIVTYLRTLPVPAAVPTQSW